jgi:hypothetical protein
MLKNNKIDPKNEIYFKNSTFYMSNISYCLNKPSNSSNSSSKPKYVWIISTKLEGSLHPSLGSFGQFNFAHKNQNFFVF